MAKTSKRNLYIMDVVVLVTLKDQIGNSVYQVFPQSESQNTTLKKAISLAFDGEIPIVDNPVPGIAVYGKYIGTVKHNPPEKPAGG